MQFGEREAIRKMAEARLDEVQSVHRRASPINPEPVRVSFLVKDDPENYHEFAAIKNETATTRIAGLKRYFNHVT